jgi:hypothetical protein
MKPQVSQHFEEYCQVTEGRVTEPGLQAGSPTSARRGLSAPGSGTRSPPWCPGPSSWRPSRHAPVTIVSTGQLRRLRTCPNPNGTMTGGNHRFAELAVTYLSGRPPAARGFQCGSSLLPCPKGQR